MLAFYFNEEIGGGASGGANFVSGGMTLTFVVVHAVSLMLCHIPESNVMFCCFQMLE